MEPAKRLLPLEHCLGFANLQFYGRHIQINRGVGMLKMYNNYSLCLLHLAQSRPHFIRDQIVKNHQAPMNMVT